MKKFNFNKHKTGIVFLLSLCLVFNFSTVLAVAPTTTIFTGDIGVNVEINIMSTYKLGEARWSVIHLFNSTNGYQMTNDTNPDMVCTMHLRDSQGFEITNIEAVVHLDHWDLNGSNGGLTPLGNYAWTVTCQDSSNEVGGYASGYFSITSDGDTRGSLDAFFFIMLILSLGVVIFGLLMRDPSITILGSFGLYFLGLYIILFGIVGIKDPTYTITAGAIVLALAAYISIKAAYELIVD